ncbi:hypothetical protein E2562_023658 [Oryza meyeriana var. granulata]|uniref:Gnk2-homologous domain-containing protein n=1 Tax=Oryza meyeriana var. granulata TaxID=110450 RepID=A0A6G1BMV0_9ORYZ|nr:hypothetical protein E2562_023658 [Oryza meyeriana var. granulata]
MRDPVVLYSTNWRQPWLAADGSDRARSRPPNLLFPDLVTSGRYRRRHLLHHPPPSSLSSGPAGISSPPLASSLSGCGGLAGVGWREREGEHRKGKRESARAAAVSSGFYSDSYGTPSDKAFGTIMCYVDRDWTKCQRCLDAATSGASTGCPYSRTATVM